MCLGVGCLRGERVAEEQFRDLVVAPLAKALVDIGGSGLVAYLGKVERGVLPVYEGCEATHVGGVGYGALAASLVVGVVGVLLYRHSEHFGKLRPVAGGVALVDHPWRGLGEKAEVVGAAHEEQVGIFLPGDSRDVGPVTQDDAAHGVGVLAGHEVIVDPFPVSEELAEREAPNRASIMSLTSLENHGERICEFTFSSGFPSRRNSMSEQSTALRRFSMTHDRWESMSMSA